MGDENLTAVTTATARRLSEVPAGPVLDMLLESVDLMDNVTRGRAAEVVVAYLTGGTPVGGGYAPHDIDLDGLAIEVKSAGLIQSWPQRAPSVLDFDIAPKSHAGAPARLSDVYVFAVHDGVRPDVPEEWTFHVVPTSRIDELCGGQQRIRRTMVQQRLGAVPVEADGLAAAVQEAGRVERG